MGTLVARHGPERAERTVLGAEDVEVFVPMVVVAVRGVRAVDHVVRLRAPDLAVEEVGVQVGTRRACGEGKDGHQSVASGDRWEGHCHSPF